jgi:HK97 family phage major capsid protein
MNKLHDMEARLAGVTKELNDLVGVRDAENREFTADESAKFDRLYTEAGEIKRNIETEKKAEEIRKQRVADKAGKETAEAKISKKFSFARAVDILAKGGKLDGAEAEIDTEGKQEMNRSGNGVSGNSITIPSFMLNYKGQQRDLTAGGVATGAEYVPDEDMGHIFGLEIAPTVLGLGATLLTGLQGNIYMPKTGAATAMWETETGAANETTPATSRVELTPNRLAAYSEISMQLLRQYPAANNILRTQIGKSVNRALDAALIEGTGSNEPLGILSLANVNTVSLGSPDGGAPTRAKLIEMWEKLAEDNSLLGDPVWLTTPGVKAYLMELNVDTGSGRFVWENDTVLGYRAVTSNNVPNDLTKGGGTNLHAIILGVFDQFIVAQWGGVDVMVDPYSRGKEGLIQVVTNSFWDSNAFHDEAFCKIVDADLS